jgi:hypothetical protein
MVYLKDGKRSKAQYNGWKARVGRRHQSGGWVKVTLDNGRSLKWRNKAWTLVKKDQRQSSFSLASLPDGVLSHMLSFLDDFVAVDAALALAATCSNLRSNMRDSVGPSMQVKANLLDMGNILQYGMLLKLSTGRIGLEELQVNAGWGETHLLSSLINNGFLESHNLLKFGAKVARSTDANYLFPRLALKDHLLSSPVSKHFIEVPERGRSVDCDTESLNFVLSRQCKKLKSLSLFMDLNNTQTLTNADCSLSKLPSLQHVTVSLVYTSGSRIGNAIIDKLRVLLASIPNLKELKMCSEDWWGSPIHHQDSYFTLQSETLETLDLLDTGKDVYFFSIVCPKLKHLRYGYEGGIIRWHPAGHNYVAGDHIFWGFSSQSPRYTTIGGEESFFGLQVPDDCAVERLRTPENSLL